MSGALQPKGAFAQDHGDARAALGAARLAGVEVEVGGGALKLKASAEPPAALMARLRQNKAGIIALLRSGGDGWSGEDWLAFFDERAGIAEFDGGLPRDEAEARAFSCCVAEWLNRNPVRSPAGRCIGCGGGNHAHDPLLPHGIEPTGHAWLHSRCWPAWHASRKAEAVAALAAIGIAAPAKFPDDFGKNGGA